MINIDSLIKHTDKKIYTPSDDTYLLLNYFNNNITPQEMDGFSLTQIQNILDMGTGTGIIALFFQLLKEKFSNFDPKVYASDLLKIALTFAKRNENEYKFKEPIRFIYSDLFKSFPSHLKHKFDIIIFNPPYLPSFDMNLSYNNNKEDSCWDGGEKGFELFFKFLEDVRNYLSPKMDSCIYYITSSRVDLQSLENKLRQKRFKNKILDKKHIFFEDIILSKLVPL